MVINKDEKGKSFFQSYYKSFGGSNALKCNKIHVVMNRAFKVVDSFMIRDVEREYFTSKFFEL